MHSRRIVIAWVQLLTTAAFLAGLIAGVSRLEREEDRQLVALGGVGLIAILAFAFRVPEQAKIDGEASVSAWLRNAKGRRRIGLWMLGALGCMSALVFAAGLS